MVTWHRDGDLRIIRTHAHTHTQTYHQARQVYSTYVRTRIRTRMHIYITRERVHTHTSTCAHAHTHRTHARILKYTQVKVTRLKYKFMTSTQALLHGDLHTGSIMVNEKSTKYESVGG